MIHYDLFYGLTFIEIYQHCIVELFFYHNNGDFDDNDDDVDDDDAPPGLLSASGGFWAEPRGGRQRTQE